MFPINWLELCGWLGGILYSIFGIPQVISIIIKGNSRGLNLVTLILMLIGALCSLIYILPQKSLPLIANFSLSFACSFIMFYYKIWERKK